MQILSNSSGIEISPFEAILEQKFNDFLSSYKNIYPPCVVVPLEPAAR